MYKNDKKCHNLNVCDENGQMDSAVNLSKKMSEKYANVACEVHRFVQCTSKKWVQAVVVKQQFYIPNTDLQKKYQTWDLKYTMYKVLISFCSNNVLKMIVTHIIKCVCV